MLLSLVYEYELEGHTSLGAKEDPLHIPFPN